MRLTVVSHPCVTPANQAFFARVAARTGWDLSLVVPAQWRTEYGTHQTVRASSFGGELVTLPVVGRGNIPLHVYASRLRSTFGRLRPDAVYVHHEPYGLATAQAFGAAGRVPALGFYSAQNIRKDYPWPVARLERFVHRRADFAFPVSDAVLDVLRAKDYGGAATVLPLPIDTERHAPGGRAPSGPLVVGYVGRLAHEKGVDLMIDALARVPELDVHAVVCGEGPVREALERRAAEAGVAARVDFRGYVPHDEAQDAYRELDLLVVPSRTVPGWTEQFGRVVIEALACGVPVAAAASGELPELLRATGGGWTFPENDVDALAERIRAAHADRGELRERAAAGRAVVVQRYSLDAVADSFVASVADAVAARGGIAAVPSSPAAAA